MRTPEELIKEVIEDVNKDYEYNAKSAIKTAILEITRQQDIIKTAQDAIRKFQTILKEITVEQLPSNTLV